MSLESLLKYKPVVLSLAVRENFGKVSSEFIMRADVRGS